MDSYDLIIVGSTDSGRRSAVQASSLGINCALLLHENSKKPHVTETARTLTAFSELQQTFKHASILGFSDVQYKLKVKDILERLHLPPLHYEASLAFLKERNVPILAGALKFTSPTHIQIGERTLHAKQFLICVDSAPSIPELPGLAGSGYYVPETISQLQALPKSLIILGSDPLGIALAQAFARLGSDVIILHSGEHLLEHEDTEAALAVQERLKQDGVKFITTIVESVERDGIRTIVYARDARTNAKTKITGSALLLACGREVPSGLNLEAAGVQYEKDRIPVDGYLRSTKSVYVAGDLVDCTRSGNALFESHTAVALSNILAPKSVTLGSEPHVIPTSPAYASVGLNEQSAIERSLPYHALKVPVLSEPYSVGEFMKLLVDTRDGKLLGAHVFAEHAAQYTSLFTLALQQGLTLSQLAQLPGSSGLTSAFQEAVRLYTQEHPPKSGFVYRLVKTFGF